MKLCLSILATATAGSALKEYEVQNAYFADEQLTLSNTRSNKQWHECGDQPKKPENGQGVMCTGNTCFAVCPIGWRSQGRWKIKCKADNTWSHSKFSPCVTCPDMSDELSETLPRGVQYQEIVNKRNHAITQFFCGDSTLALGIKDEWFKKGGQKKNVKCLCKNGQNGDPAWKKSCSWSYKNALWVPSDVNGVTCGPYVEPKPEPEPECVPEENVWYGETDIAMYKTNAGSWHKGTGLNDDVPDLLSMFDNDPLTMWHNHKNNEENLKIVAIIFKEPINFTGLTIQKRNPTDCPQKCNDRYLNVCLVLDSNTDDAICTDTTRGFSGFESSQFITWSQTKAGVKRVDLQFRDIQHAQIADLKIFYDKNNCSK